MTCTNLFLRRVSTVCLVAQLTSGCQEKDVDASGSGHSAAAGETCDPGADTGMSPCVEDLACERAGSSDAYLCAAPLELHGQVFDALSGEPLADALVSALDATGAPVSNVVRSDAEGNYVLRVQAARDPQGLVLDALKWTLFASAADYQPYPAGLRRPLPIDAADTNAVTDDRGDEAVALHVIDNATTGVALLPLPEDQRGGRTILGTIDALLPGGTLVVAEGVEPARYTIADLSGDFTLFNVPPEDVSIVGYRQGLQLAPQAVASTQTPENLTLRATLEGDDALPVISGSVNIVNGGGSNMTSVVLVPSSLYNVVLERGPVPFGLRAPGLPAAPEISGAFAISGVPMGTYKVLAAFENDLLVRDPDMTIAGTTIQEITVGDMGLVVEQSFKVTGALAVVSPGARTAELLEDTPTFVFADDSSEDRYEVSVYDAFGELVWEDLEVPGVSGQDNVEVKYDGPDLEQGMYYQFRATSFRDRPNGITAISRTEDLLGVFIAG